MGPMHLVASALQRREGGRGVAIFFEKRRVRVLTSLHARVHLGEVATVCSTVYVAHTSVRDAPAWCTWDTTPSTKDAITYLTVCSTDRTLSHGMHLSISMKRSTTPQNLQLIVYYYLSKY